MKDKRSASNSSIISRRSQISSDDKSLFPTRQENATITRGPLKSCSSHPSRKRDSAHLGRGSEYLHVPSFMNRALSLNDFGIRAGELHSQALTLTNFGAQEVPSALSQALELISLIFVAQRPFENFSSRSMGQFIDKFDFVGQPPFGDFIAKIGDHVCFADICTGFFDDK